MVTVREMDVPMLELRCRGQNDVRPIGGVSLKVLENNREKILTCESAQHRVAVRSDRCRIGVVDDERANWRSANAGIVGRQRLTEPDHVDRTDGRRKIGTFERLFIELEIRAGGELHTPTRMPPMAGDCGQTGDGTHRHAATGMSLESIIHANERGAGASVALGELRDLCRGDSGNFLDALGGVLASSGAQLVLTQRMSREIVAVLEPQPEDYVHHPESERGIRPRPDGNPLVALGGGSGAQRIDGDDRRASLASLEDEWPEMRIRGESVGSPEQHQVAIWNCV